MPFNAKDLWSNPEVPPGPNIEENIKRRMIRSYRNNLLLQSEWTQITDSELSAADVDAAKQWRKDVRRIPLPGVAADDTVFPDPPFDMTPA